MKLKSFKNFFSLLIVFSYLVPLNSEEKIDIWKNKKNTEVNNETNSEIDPNKIEAQKIQGINNQNIKIVDSIIDTSEENKVFGIYDPSDFNFDLNMWTSTKADDVRASLKRIKKIKLSKTSNEILENVVVVVEQPLPKAF